MASFSSLSIAGRWRRDVNCKRRVRSEEIQLGSELRGLTSGDHIGMQAAKQPTAGSMTDQEYLAVYPLQNFQCDAGFGLR